MGFAGSCCTASLVSISTAKFGISGFEKFGWLNILKKSTLNCMFTFSPNFVFLTIEKSKLRKEGPTKALRGSLPKCCPPAQVSFTGSHVHGAANALRFKNLDGADVPAKGSPTMSGRSKNSLLPLKFSNECTVNGWPLERRKIPFNDHPDVSFFACVNDGIA